MAGTRKKTGKTSRYVGVTRFSDAGRYQAFVKVEGKRIHLGMWANEDEAATARDRAALFLDLDVPLNRPKSSRWLGPAEPEELRRLSRQKAKRAEATSPYFGVSFDSRRSRWAAVCVGDRQKVQIAQFDRPEDAAVAYDRVALEMLGSDALLNFPELNRRPASMAQMRRWARSLLKEQSQVSRFRGVRFGKDSTGKNLGGHLAHRGRSVHVGQWSTERAAAIAYDRTALQLFGAGTPLNFPTQSRRAGPATVAALRAQARKRFKARTSSQYRGVSWAKREQRWEAKIKQEGKTKHLGLYDVEEAAAEAYDHAAVKVFGTKAVLNFK